MGLLLSVLSESGSAGSFELSTLTMKLKLVSAALELKSSPLTVTWQPAPQVVAAFARGAVVGHTVAGRKEIARTSTVTHAVHNRRRLLPHGPPGLKPAPPRLIESVPGVVQLRCRARIAVRLPRHGGPSDRHSG